MSCLASRARLHLRKPQGGAHSVHRARARAWHAPECHYAACARTISRRSGALPFAAILRPRRSNRRRPSFSAARPAPFVDAQVPLPHTAAPDRQPERSGMMLDVVR